MLKSFVLFLLLLPVWVHAQYNITGKVINLYDKKPVAKASVFLSNTTIGTATADDGSYVLTNVKPGQYDVVVTAVGYETFTNTIQLSQTLNIPYIELTPRTIDLNAVIVKPDPDWQNNYNTFKRELLGYTPYADQCKILNPEVLTIEFDKGSRNLTAKSSEYLEIENPGLGYKLKYLLTQFIKDYRNGSMFYQGNVLFIPMQGKPSQIRKWQKARLDAYLGSSQHYLRSIIGNGSAEEGFKTMQLIRKPNLQRLPDSLIKTKIAKFRAASINRQGNHISFQKNDSLDYWLKQDRVPKIIQTLVSTPIRMDSLVKRTNQPGVFALGFKDVLYIMYTKSKYSNNFSEHLLNASNYPTSLMNFTAPYAFFDINGIITNPTAVIFEGEWANDRLAKMLPYDYEPTEKEKQKP